jgi:hypothetical protein
MFGPHAKRPEGGLACPASCCRASPFWLRSFAVLPPPGRKQLRPVFAP